MLKRTRADGILAVVILAFLVLGSQYALRTPDWQAPDEPAHYNYVRQVAGQGCCPVIEPADWDADQLETLKTEQFPENADLSAISYEDWQPPLYYLAAVPLFNVTGGSLHALRFLSLIFGAGLVIATYVVIRRLFPPYPVLALSAAVFVAFLPQNMAILASANNDSLGWLLLGILLTIAMGYVGNPVSPGHDGRSIPWDESRRPHAAAMGGFLGLIFLTKLTPILPAVVIIILAIAWRWRIEGRGVLWLLQQVAWGIVFGALIGLPWWVRNAEVYGFPDMLGFVRHNAVVIGQPRTADLMAQIGTATYWDQYLTTTYHSFWGQFGWMGVPMQPRVYLGIGIFLAWAFAGLVILLARFRSLWELIPVQRAGAWILISTVLTSVLVYAYYNLTFVQFQGRYLYGALIPLGLFVSLGAMGWALQVAEMVKNERLSRFLTWLPLLTVCWMPALAIYALVHDIIPNLH